MRPRSSTTAEQAPGEIRLAADEIQLDGSINSGTARTVFTPSTADRAISLSGVDEISKLNLTAAELDNVTASVIVVGGASFTGGLAIEGSIALVPATALSLINAGSISQTGALTVEKLNADGASVELTQRRQFHRHAEWPRDQWHVRSGEQHRADRRRGRTEPAASPLRAAMATW